VPFAAAVWDGARHERSGNKALTGWRLLRLARYPMEEAWVAELSWGYRAGELGDPARGKALVDAICAACHHAGEARTARPGIAPDLSSIGLVSTPAYLRDSLLDPSAVVVPGPNPAQHQDRSRKPGALGAWPLDDSLAWSSTDAGGRRISTMPSYDGLPREEVAAMVAYLMTLGVPPGERRQP
jgi:complex iron-sulfur molybdoenzyme family reductase subunit gamma